nr:cation:proton antiporter [uncultured Gellertiella sp.]
MAATGDLSTYSDAMVVLGIAGVVIPLMRRFGVNPVLGFMGMGAALGPHALGSLIGRVPLMSWFVVVDVHRVEAIAELGIIFLLFLIGLELSFARLMTMRRLVFGFGSAQILLSAGLLAGLMKLAGIVTTASIILGACLALSSTAVVIELLAARGKMTSSTGRLSFSALLAQDIAVIPILLLVGLLATGGGGGLLANIGKALLQAAAALALITGLGRFFMRPLFRLVASLNSPDVFLATVLFVIVGAGFLAALFGLSMALGAFVAGLLLSETEYRKAVEALVEPFKGLLLGMFFFSVGMSIDLAILREAPLLLLLVVVVILVAKACVVLVLGRLFHRPLAARFETALLLAPAGEFAFVGIGAAGAAGVVDPALSRLALTAVALGMLLLPALAFLGSLVARHLKRRDAAAEPPEPPPEMQGHAIVVGHGRVGKVVTGLLARHKIPFLAVDGNAAEVARDRREGQKVYFGDATSLPFLVACGLDEATAVIITTGTRGPVDRVIEIVRAARPEIPVIARATDAAHARHLYKLGVTDAVPETIEASLHLSEASLVSLGVPMGLVIASIHARRDAFRDELKESRGGRPAPGDRGRVRRD